MANTRSAEKQQRQAETHKVRNRAGMSRLRNEIKKTRAAIESGEKTEITSALRTVYSEIDKAAKKGFIKDNTASRYKSRLNAAAKKVVTAAS
ncbi:MAG: 30S ribosomal protein S20 [Thermoanaerobaculia bacterium]